MIEKRVRLAITREEGFFYFLKEDGIWRSPATRDEEGELLVAEGAPEERVRDLGFEMDEQHLYVLDDDGDVSQFRIIPGARATGDRRLAPLPDSAPSQKVNPSPTRFWLMSIDDSEVDMLVVPDDTATLTVGGAPDGLTAGDALFLWLNKPYHCVIALLEIGGMVDGDEGTVAFEGRFLTHTLESPQYRDELLGEDALAQASFLSPKYKEGIIELTARQAQRLTQRVKQANPVVAPVVDAWLEALSVRAAAEPPSEDQKSDSSSVEEGGFIEAHTIEAGREYRILSIQPPWAWSVIFAGKDVENRSWTTPYRGTILIHASSKKFTGKALEETRIEIARCSGIDLAKVPTEFPRAQILGFVDIVDCIANSRSLWAYRGEEHWILRRPRALEHPVLSVDGKLNLWHWTAPE